MTRYLLAADPQRSFNTPSDTSIRLARACAQRRIPIDYLDLSQHDWQQDTKRYLSALPVREIKSVDLSRPGGGGREDIFDLGPRRYTDVSEYAVILQRKDPPVDEVYKGHAAHFARAPAHIVQINNPKLAATLSEHILPTQYPDLCIPTTVCHSFE